ncbi:EamA family transporter RarD [Arthrobacter mobilis]|uniref:EamA family transporter RarD n=1 Tax=Arthrobacter mobilis TaxID=2724944 RepID=A0A7X6HAH1_9MICC|nr:EamA family transporter RarD [Arthrobacter mobilis]NKX53486.1 EamA family transporter RarD [Arthrobacter mobilis]
MATVPTNAVPPNPSAAPATAAGPSPEAAGPGGGRRPRGAGAGMAYGLAAYGLWGVLPLYFAVLAPAGPLEIVANRVVWSLAFCLLLITAIRGWASFRAALASPRVLGTLSLAAVLIAANWLVYTLAVLNAETIQASLGYFINPLVSVLLGVLLLKERLRAVQWVALGIALLAVLVLSVAYGGVPWLALALALSFGFYGLVKKNVGTKVDAVTSLSVETLVLVPASLAVMAVLASAGSATLLGHGPGHFWLMAAGGLITALPLLFFGAAARRLPLSTVGMLQYLAPLTQFILALAVFHEPMPAERWAGFALVWLSLIILTADMIRSYRVGRRAEAAERALDRAAAA